MARFEEDWATARIVAGYAMHLWAEAQKNGELAPNTHYNYLKDNAAKRPLDAPWGRRPGLSKSRGQTDVGDNDAGSPEAGPSSLPNVNTTADEELMDTPGTFGSIPPSDDEGGCQGGPRRSPEIQSTLVWSSCWGATGSAGRSTQRGEQRRVVRTRGNKGEVGVTRDQCCVW